MLNQEQHTEKQKQKRLDYFRIKQNKGIVLYEKLCFQPGDALRPKNCKQDVNNYILGISLAQHVCGLTKI